MLTHRFKQPTSTSETRKTERKEVKLHHKPMMYESSIPKELILLTHSFTHSLIHQTGKVSFVPRICLNTKMNTRICLSTKHYQSSQRQRQTLITELCEECYRRVPHRVPGEPGLQERGVVKGSSTRRQSYDLPRAP